MCRIVFLKWINKQKAIDYVDAFYKAGYDDPHLQNVLKVLNVKKLNNQHLHWWGYLLVTKNSIDTYLSWEAFFNDESWFEDLKNKINNISWEFMLMSELRVTDEWYVSALNSHPFFFSSKNWYEWWFFYNWLLDYEKLAKLEWIDYSNFKRKNGTTIMGHCIANELERWSDIKTALSSPNRAQLSWYNLMSFINNNLWEFKAYILTHVMDKYSKNELYLEYNRLIKKDDEDLFFVWANAISIYRKDNYESMKNWDLLEFDIDFVEEYYFDSYDGKD